MGNVQEMPDQSSAASEHALLQEITAPLATLPDDPVPVVADVDFPITIRGYDRLAVDAYVKKTSQLVAELQATRSPEAAVRRALERVGEQISGILQRAHETAEQITAQSRSEAEDRLEVARREAAQITAAAEQRVKELDAETDRVWAERHRIVEDVRELARQLVALGDAASQRFPAAEETAPVGPVAGQLGSEVEAEPIDGPHPTDEGDDAEPAAGGDVDATAVMPPLEPGEYSEPGEHSEPGEDSVPAD